MEIVFIKNVQLSNFEQNIDIQGGEKKKFICL